MANLHLPRGNGVGWLIRNSATQLGLEERAPSGSRSIPEGNCARERRAAGGARPKAASLATILAIGFVLAPGSSCRAQGLASARLKSVVAQPVTPYMLTGVEGFAAVRYLSDENTSLVQGGNMLNRSRQVTLSEELFVLTHNYIYHPTLLTLDVGGGPIIDRVSNDINDVKSNDRRQSFNFAVAAAILREKPYNGELFFSRRTDTQNIGSTQQLPTETQRYGGTVRVLNPVTPVPAELTISRTTNKGTGTTYVTDDQTDQLLLRMSTAIGKNIATRLDFTATRQASASGNTSLPITVSHTDDNRLTLDTNLKLGERKEYDVTNIITLNNNKQSTEQSAAVRMQDFSFGIDVRGRHSEELQSDAHYAFVQSKQNDYHSTSHSANGGITLLMSPDLRLGLGARGQVSKSDAVASNLYGIDGSAQYRQALWFGQATAGYNFAYQRRDQKVSQQTAQVLSERVTLFNLTFSALAKSSINAATVVVTDLGRNQTYVRGVHYELDELGTRLRIRRLTPGVVNGEIAEGAEVLVDYSYDTGGSYATSQFDNSFNLGWTYRSYLSVYLRHTNSAVSLISGDPTVPINPGNSTLIGGRTDLPMAFMDHAFQLGVAVEREVRHEVLVPYKRLSLDANILTDVPLIKDSNLWLGTRRLRTEYDLSPDQGVKLVGYDLRFSAPLGWGVQLNAEATRARDTGTPTLRESSLAMVKLKWRRRKLQASFDVRREKDTQGVLERTRTLAQFLLRRDF